MDVFMSEERPVSLHFFDKSNTVKFGKLCNQLGLNYSVVTEEDLSDQVTTQPMKATQRRELIAKWANISMERITE